MYDFDTVVDRSNTDAVKLELASTVFGTSDLIPLWIADMDFPCPAPVAMTLRERMQHPIYGYTLCTPRFAQAIKQWQHRRNHWDIDTHWVEWCPGVVPALSISVQTFTSPGDGVIIQPPVYPPFFDVVRQNGRTLECNHLIDNDGHFEIDFDGFERLAAKPTTKLFILCHPHNPVGREWTVEELTRLGNICKAHGITVLADEIHSDLMLDGHQHHPFASISPEFADMTVTFMAASKTFNIAGLSTSYLIASNESLRSQYIKAQSILHLENNMLGCLALQAAYANCEPWLNELLAYISDNAKFVRDYLRDYLPAVKISKSEATYLLWLDFSAYGLSHDDLKYIICRRARLGLNDGSTFGEEYQQHFRINLASPQSVIEEAMGNLSKAFADIKVQ